MSEALWDINAKDTTICVINVAVSFDCLLCNRTLLAMDDLDGLVWR